MDKSRKASVSIIVPVYNVELYLKRCIDSLLHQTYENLEIILVDDGSVDDSGKICEEYREQDTRIVVIHKVNEGQSKARNIAMNLAHGDFIAFVDSDDYVSPRYIEAMMNQQQQYDSDIVVCNYNIVDQLGEIQKKKSIPIDGIISQEDYWSLETGTYYMFCVALWNKLFKAEIWQSLRLKEGKYAEDSFAMTEYIKGAQTISIISEPPLYYYFQRSDSLVHNFTVKNLDSIEARLERANYYGEQNYYNQMQKSLKGCIPLFQRACEELDMGDVTIRKRYVNLRAKYKKLFRIAFKRFKLTRLFIDCFLYYLSDDLFINLHRVIRRVKRVIK